MTNKSLVTAISPNLDLFKWTFMDLRLDLDFKLDMIRSRGILFLKSSGKRFNQSESMRELT